ncbi:MAG: carbohydrate binding domain-containing protein, partial [Patescibacteria group bacterium]
NTVGMHAGIQQLNIPVQANKNYRYTFYYNLLSGAMATNLGIRDSNGDFEGKIVSLLPTGGIWKQYTRDFTVPSSFTGDFRDIIRIKNGEGYIDNVSITEIPTISLVKDGNMEANNLNDWRSYGLPTRLTEKTTIKSHSPIKSIHLNTIGTSAGIQQLAIPVKANKSYRFSFYYNSSGVMNPYLGRGTSNGDFEGKVIQLATTNNAWKLYMREFTIPADFASDFRIIIKGTNSDSYIDDVVIEEIFSRTLVMDGNMEANNLIEWGNYGVPTVPTEKSAVRAKSPTKSLHINTTRATAGVQQLDVPLKAGKKYRLTFYYNLVSGALTPRLGIGTSNSDFEGKIVSLSSTGGIWKQYIRDFTVPANFVRDFRLLAIIKNGEGYIDDVNIELLP